VGEPWVGGAGDPNPPTIGPAGPATLPFGGVPNGLPIRSQPGLSSQIDPRIVAGLSPQVNTAPTIPNQGSFQNYVQKQMDLDRNLANQPPPLGPRGSPIDPRILQGIASPQVNVDPRLTLPPTPRFRDRVIDWLDSRTPAPIRSFAEGTMPWPNQTVTNNQPGNIDAILQSLFSQPLQSQPSYLQR